jgi:penicillin-insensitive murein endopeptidase
VHRVGVLLALLLASCAGSEASRGSSPAASRATRTEATAPTPSAETADGPADEPATEDPAPIADEPDPIAELLALDGSSSRSIGAPNDGHVEGAVALPEAGPGFRSNPRRPNATAFHGTVEMVQALVRAAAVVNEALPGGELLINDLGLPEGGPIAHHGSHRAGRDVDVLFYLIDRHGEPMESVGAFLDARGRGFDFKDLEDPRDDVLVRMDLPRTWRFVQALLEGPHADDVQRIFVVEHLRTLILRQAERARAPVAIRERFADITCQPGYPHDDHLHIRFHCTVEDMAAGCEDTPPVYAWRRAQLRALDLTPAIHRPGRDREPSPTVTNEEARSAAGPMHARVTEWLERREAWLHAPHPGRTYCR